MLNSKTKMWTWRIIAKKKLLNGLVNFFHCSKEVLNDYFITKFSEMDRLKQTENIRNWRSKKYLKNESNYR